MSNPPPRPNKRSRWLPTLAGGYSLLLIGCQLARLTALQHQATIQLISVFSPWLYLPLLLFAGLALRRRHWRTLLILGLPVVGFGAAFGSLLLPKHQPPQPATLRVMNWNVYYFNTFVADVSAAVRAENPDLLVVQELGVGLSAPLARELRELYPYQQLYPATTPAGFGIFSKLPFEEIEPPQLCASPGRCHVVRLNFNGQQITVINMHPQTPRLIWRLGLPGLDTAAQDASIAEIATRVRQEAGPLLLVGDLNTTDQQPNYALIRNQLGDAFAEAGWGFGFTFPAAGKLGFVPNFPAVRIDYIFHSSHWSASAAWTRSNPTSDHRYLVADLQLK